MKTTGRLTKLAFFAALALLLGLVSTASATEIITPGFYIDGSPVAGFSLNPDGSYSAVSGLNSATVTFNLGADPQLIWSVNATNASNVDANVTVAFPAFATPGFPGAILVHSSASVTVTDSLGAGQGTAYVLVFPVVGVETTIDTNYTTDNIGNIINFWGSAPSFIPASINGNSKSQDSEFFGVGPNGPNDWFLEIVSFTISAYDATGMSGNCDFDVIPIPASVLLFGSGMLGMGLLGWRRRT